MAGLFYRSFLRTVPESHLIAESKWCQSDGEPKNMAAEELCRRWDGATQQHTESQEGDA